MQIHVSLLLFLIYTVYMNIKLLSLSFCCFKLMPCCMGREAAKVTNVGKLLETRGEEFLGSGYKDPISSFSNFQEFSVSNPEVVVLLI